MPFDTDYVLNINIFIINVYKKDGVDILKLITVIKGNFSLIGNFFKRREYMYYLCNYKIYNNLKAGVLETPLYDQVLILWMTRLRPAEVK